MSWSSFMENEQYLAQVGHTLGGYSVVLTAAYAFHSWDPVLLVLGIGVVLASLKEFVFDVSSWGEGDSWSDSIMDWSFYMLGALAGLGVAATGIR